MPQFKELAQQFKTKIDAFEAFIGVEIKRLNEQIKEFPTKDIPSLDALMNPFMAAVKTQLTPLEQEWYKLKKNAKTEEDKKSIPTLKNVDVIKKAYINLYYVYYYEERFARLHIGLFYGKVDAFLTNFFNPLFNNTEKSWQTIKEELDKGFSSFLETISKEYENISLLRKKLLSDIKDTNQKYGLNLGLQEKVLDDLKTTTLVLAEERADHINRYKNNEYKKLVDDCKQVKDDLERKKIATFQHFDRMNEREKDLALAGLLNDYAMLIEKIEFDKANIEDEIVRLKTEYPYLTLTMPIFPNVLDDSENIKQMLEKERARAICKFKTKEYQAFSDEYEKLKIGLEKKKAAIFNYSNNTRITIDDMCAMEDGSTLNNLLRDYLTLIERMEFRRTSIEAEIAKLQEENSYLTLAEPLFPAVFIEDINEKSQSIRERGASKSGWECAILNDLDAEYAQLQDLKRAPPTYMTDRAAYEDHFKQRIQPLDENKKIIILQVLKHTLDIRWDAFSKKFARAKREREFQEESAVYEGRVHVAVWPAESKVLPPKFDDRESLVDDKDPINFSPPGYAPGIRPQVKEVSTERHTHYRSILQRKKAREEEQKNAASSATQSPLHRELEDLKQGQQQAAVPQNPPIFNKCHFLLSCLCFGVGGLIYLAYCAYQSYQRSSFGYLNNCLFRQRPERQPLDADLDQSLIYVR